MLILNIDWEGAPAELAVRYWLVLFKLKYTWKHLTQLLTPFLSLLFFQAHIKSANGNTLEVVYDNMYEFISQVLKV